MFSRSISPLKYSVLLALAALFFISSLALAGNSPDGEIKVEKIDDKIIITSVGDDGELETQVIDLTGIGEMVDDALAGLESTQFQLRLGQDNMVSIAMDDTAIEVDLDLILSQVGAALSNGLEEFQASEWAQKGPRAESNLADDELAVELEKLREEMRNLKRELRKLKTD